ncbi:MAG: hypothetical protein FJ109_10790 [Deltaproteobacteria bacterium]|nr:hypothetical protein [Deltaproteobacteria bacterium]
MGTKVKTAIDIAGAVERSLVFEKIRRLEDYPRFMPDVKRVRVLEQSDTAGASEWDVEIEGCPLHWVERDCFDGDAMVFSFDSVEGDFDRFSGRWEVLETASGLRVEFEVEYLVGIPVIEDIIGPILKVKMERNTMKMLEHLKAEVEASLGLESGDTGLGMDPGVVARMAA